KEADLLLYVVDVSNEEYEHQLKVTKNVVKELGAQEIPYIIVQNKKDRLDPEKMLEIIDPLETTTPISALNGDGLDCLISRIEETIMKDYKIVNLIIPFESGSMANYILENTKIIEHEYLDDGLHVKAYLNRNDINKYNLFLV
ncbi:MAG: GTPase HflX, partial [Psychrilyobacter sp.]